MTSNTRVKAYSALAIVTSMLLAPASISATADAIVGAPIDLEPSFSRVTESYQVQFSPTHPTTLAYGVKSQQSQVVKINPTDGTVDATITVGAGPVALAFTPDGTEAFVANYTGSSVSIIDTTSDTVSDTISVPGSPYDVAMSPDGDFAIFSCYGDDTIKVMSTDTLTIVKTYRLKHSGVWQARYTPDGTKIFAVANRQGAILVIDTVKEKVIKKIPSRGYPWWLEVSPDGSEVMFTDYVAGKTSSVAIINVRKNKIVDRVNIGSSAYALTYAPDGDHAYVVNDSANEVSVIDTTTRRIVQRFTSSATVTLIPTINPAGTLGYIGDRYGVITTFTPY